MSLLSLSGVTRRYGDVVAVDRVDLAIPSGGLTAIVGASGSGKTTLLRLIAGFEAPDTGRIALGDTVLADERGMVPAHRREIGFVAQEGALFPHMSVAANVAFGMERGRQEASVEALLAAVELDPSVGRRMPHELSGGQQQRVALARALARRPKLMLLDEPFSALDAGLRSSMRTMVKRRLAEEGVTGIVVTHDQQEALSLADYLVVLEDGRVAQAGSPREIYQTPRTLRTAMFLGDVIILDALVRDGEAMTPLGAVRVSAEVGDGPCRLMLRPEQVRLIAWTEGAQTATIESSAFEGAITTLVFTAGGARFTVRSFSSDAPIAGRVGVMLLGTAHALRA
jgi:iron(III) transport system ATP-binding protein